MVALTGPSSTTWAPVGAIKRPSEVPPEVENRVSIPVFSLDGSLAGTHQFARSGQKWLATDLPLDIVIKVMAVEDFKNPLLQGLVGDFRRETEVEVYLTFSGNHIGCTSAGMNLPDLEAGRREIFITLVPLFAG